MLGRKADTRGLKATVEAIPVLVALATSYKGGHANQEQWRTAMAALECVMLAEDGQFIKYIKSDRTGTERLWQALVARWGDEIVSPQWLRDDHC